ncbi:MAG: DEAD/DEAH box helicase [Pseudomonadota bacterium]
MRNNADLKWVVVHHELLPEKAPSFKKTPRRLHLSVQELIDSVGIESLYCHQVDAIEKALQRENVALSTSTSSGKTLCYQIPALDRLVREPDSHVLMLFPLKALERDQLDSFLNLSGKIGISAAVYDGDTPDSDRRRIRSEPPRVIITNPDMLHLGLLAFHESWRNFFSKLSLIVLDEVHTYKGIFGSHVAQVLLRLKRICESYGNEPTFVSCSATIGNPEQFVSTLISDEVSVVDKSGAPSPQRHFVFLNPLLSPYTVASTLFVKAIESGLKTIVFTRSRKITELITLWATNEAPGLRRRISSYRAGFLPEERREIEARLFSGELDGVISTSALEMGIDVGGLDLCILVGYPGTIVNTWQRGGRVGRQGRPSAVVMVAGQDALDQYFVRNPSDFFARQCEQATLDPLNVEVLKKHIPCAAAEIPIRPFELWIKHDEAQRAVDSLVTSGIIYRSPDGALNSANPRPHRDVDLRNIGNSYSIFLEGSPKPIGMSSGARVFHECHEGAIYLHRTRQYVVTWLDLKKRNVFVRPSTASYYTRSRSEKETTILGRPLRSRNFPGFVAREARLRVTENMHGYEKRLTRGQDLIGVVDLNLPPIVFETIGLWIEISDDIKQAIKALGLNFMGGIHALEHAAISMFPLFALCERDDIGGISCPEHEQVRSAAIFIYDGHPGGVGLSSKAFDVLDELLRTTSDMVKGCHCDTGCPSCIHSPKCGSGNKPLDKKACETILEYLLHPNRLSRSHSPPEAKPSPHQYKCPDIPIETVTPVSKEKLLIPIEEIAVNENKEQTPEIVFFDLETQKLAEDVGGWKNISKMMLSVAVTFSDSDGIQTFNEESVGELIRTLSRADLIVGFNQVKFDYEVLSAYTTENLRKYPNLDMLLEIQKLIGHRLSLDHLAQFTLGRKKSGSGVDAPLWFRQGRLDLLQKYCTDDVILTRDLYNFAVQNGFVKYKRRDGQTSKINVKWGLTKSNSISNGI